MGTARLRITIWASPVLRGSRLDALQNRCVIDWPIFNIADSLLVCGAALLVWHAVRAEHPGPQAENVDA